MSRCFRSFRSRLVRCSSVAVLSAALASPAAGAGVSVTSDGERVTVTGYRAGGVDHRQWSVEGPGALRCRELIEETGGLIDADGAALGPDWPSVDPDRTARWRYWLDCRRADGTAVELSFGGRGFVYVDEIIDFDEAVRRAAQHFLATLDGPPLAIDASPPVGLVGVAQGFAPRGHAAIPAETVFDVFGHRVDVELHVESASWSFGDGAVLERTAGDATSALTHRYRVRSTTAARPDAAYEVALTLRVGVRYRLDGSAPLAAEPPLSLRATRTLVVREAQAVGYR